MYTLGIDIGSTTSKCVILQDGASITARSLQLGGLGTDGPEEDRKSTRLNSSHDRQSRMPSSA